MTYKSKENMMKKLLLTIATFFLTAIAYSQDQKIFSLSPMTKNTKTVNGVVVGIGHFEAGKQLQHINGINVDLMPFSLLILMHRDPNDLQRDSVFLISNGLNLATGGFLSGTIHNGLSIALYSLANDLNGFSIHAAYNSAQNLRGLHISGIGNYANKSVGINVGLYNKSSNMTGLQLGLINKSTHIKGLQIGLFNYSDSVNGLQIGFINRNAKRVLPFLNF